MLSTSTLQLQERINRLNRSNQYLEKQVQLLKKEVLENQKRFSLLYEATSEGIVIYKDGQIELVNEAMHTLFGYTHREMIGLDIHELIAPQYQYETTDLWNQWQTFETVCIKKDGTIFPVQIKQKTSLKYDNDAQVIIIQDLTQNKESAQKLLDSELRYRKLFQESNDAIYISTLDGTLEEVNKATLQLFGYTEQEMIGRNALSLYANSKDRKKFRKAIWEKGALTNYEVELVKKNGSRIDCLLSTTAKKDSKGTIIGYQGIIRDITQQKRTNELLKNKELADRSANMKAKFLANMSHEIRTPMNAVMGMTNLLYSTHLGDDQQKYVNGIKSASEHLLVLINDILDFSKIEAGKLSIEKIHFSLQEVLNNIIQTFKFKAANKNLSFSVEANNNLPTALIGDPTRLTQIIMNLVSNAIKFTKKGFVQVRVKLFAQDMQSVTIAFEIEDSGIGIPQKKVATIFDAFAQVGSDTSRKFGGTGLGLAITKKLVDMQGGAIKVKSVEGQGSIFIFSIKYKKGKPDEIKHQNFKLSAISITPLQPLHILVVDDNELNRVVAADTIKKWGKNLCIDMAENGKEAINKIMQHSYDLILMDVQMPIMDGYEATKCIRQQLKLTDLPILAMTAYATTGEAEKTIMAGMNAYISKPFNPKDLYNKIFTLTKHINKSSQQFQQTDRVSNPLQVLDTTQVVDFTFLKSATGNDVTLISKMLKIMIKETPEEIAKMELYCKQKNWPKLKGVAHKFKSTVTYMGIKNLKTTIKDLQKYAETEQNLDLLPTLVQEVKKICLPACEELKIELQRINN